MQLTLSRVCKLIGIVLLIGVAMPVFAESAPVYDADSMPQQFVNVGDPDQGQDLPPPPPPDQERAFVPIQGQMVSPPVSSSSSMGLDQRMRRVEQQINNMQNNDASARIEALQSQVQSLRSQVEQLTHRLQQVQQAQDQQKNLYADIDKRLSQQNNRTISSVAVNTEEANKITNDELVPPTPKSSRKAKAAKIAALEKPAEPSADNSTANSTASIGDQPNVAEEQQIYQMAYNLIKAKKYDEAVDTLQNMLQKYPSGQFASNAHYWLGELYGLMGKHDQALTEFSTVVKTFPDSPRISDAQLKVGLIFASQSKWSEAKAAFKKVINRYPGTSSARLAAEQIKQIKQAGH